MGVRAVDGSLPGGVERIRVAVEFDPNEKSLVDSSFKGESDINLIVARYRKTGVLPASARSAAARYGDFSQVPDFAEMHLRVEAAREMFAALPAKVRREFDNDPGKFLSASFTPEGRELLKELGLGAPDKPGEVVEPALVAPAPAKPAPKAPAAGKAPKPELPDQD